MGSGGHRSKVVGQDSFKGMGVDFGDLDEILEAVRAVGRTNGDQAAVAQPFARRARGAAEGEQAVLVEQLQQALKASSAGGTTWWRP